MIDFQKYEAVDKKLSRIAKKLRPLYYANPLNEKEQKIKFLGEANFNPVFEYRGPEYELDSIEDELQSVSIPPGELSEIFERKRNNFVLENDIIRHMGESTLVQGYTTTLHGSPSELTIQIAEKILQTKQKNLEQKMTITAGKMKIALEAAIKEYGIDDWTVEYSEKNLTSVNPALRKITICNDRKFSEFEQRKLIKHEVDVHVLRAANGYLQPLDIFAVGLPGYVSTEEGLALYHQEKNNCMPNESWIKIALNVVAVDSVLQQENFRQTFDKLISYDIDNDLAWQRTLRAHRGGGIHQGSHLFGRS